MFTSSFNAPQWKRLQVLSLTVLLFQSVDYAQWGTSTSTPTYIFPSAANQPVGIGIGTSATALTTQLQVTSNVAGRTAVRVNQMQGSGYIFDWQQNGASKFILNWDGKIGLGATPSTSIGFIVSPTFTTVGAASNRVISAQFKTTNPAALTTITEASAINIENAALGGANSKVTNLYGILVKDQTAGTNNYSIYTGLGKVRFGDAVDIVGSAKITSTSNALTRIDGNQGILELNSTASTGRLWSIASKTDGVLTFDYNNTTSPFKIESGAPNDAIHVMGNGNVGIGIPLPGSKLTVNGTLNASGATTLSSTLGVTGATTFSSTLAVTGTTTLSGSLQMNNSQQIVMKNAAGTLRNVLALQSSNNLEIGGTVDGGLTFLYGLGNTAGSYNSSGNWTFAKPATMASTLGVTGATNFSSTLDVAGTTTLSAGLQMNNGQQIMMKNAAGTFRNVLGLQSSNNLEIGGTVDGGLTFLYGLGNTAGSYNSSGNWTFSKPVSMLGDVTISGKLNVTSALAANFKKSAVGDLYNGTDIASVVHGDAGLLGPNQYGLWVTPTFGSQAINNGTAGTFGVTLANASFGQATTRGVHVLNPTRTGGTASINTNIGIDVNDQTAGSYQNFAIRTGLGKVQFGGSVNVIGGNLTVGSDATPYALAMNGPAGQNRALDWLTAGSPRWRMEATNTAESGTSSGSDLALRAYTNTGGGWGTALIIRRDTRHVEIQDDASVGGNLSVTKDLKVGASVFKVDAANGRVGIGNANPNFALDVTGSANFLGGITVLNDVTATGKGKFGSSLLLAESGTHSPEIGLRLQRTSLTGNSPIGISSEPTFGATASGTGSFGKAGYFLLKTSATIPFEMEQGAALYVATPQIPNGSNVKDRYGLHIADQTGNNTGMGGNAYAIKTGTGKVSFGDEVRVAGDLIANRVLTKSWGLNNEEPPDYVFEKEYKLASLEQVENFISKNKHLPEIPSAVEIKKDGVDLADMNMKLLKKVEELTLYAISQNKRMTVQEKEIADLRKSIRAFGKSKNGGAE